MWPYGQNKWTALCVRGAKAGCAAWSWATCSEGEGEGGMYDHIKNSGEGVLVPLALHLNTTLISSEEQTTSL